MLESIACKYFKEFCFNFPHFSCGEHQDSDYVEFSNFDEAEDRKMKKRCGQEIPPETKSDGAFFRVTFKSDDSYDGTGFLGHYKFIQGTQNNIIRESYLLIKATSTLFQLLTAILKLHRGDNSLCL